MGLVGGGAKTHAVVGLLITSLLVQFVAYGTPIPVVGSIVAGFTMPAV